MLTKIQKWGNSLALRIPKAIAIAADLQNNSTVELSVMNGNILVNPIATPHWTLEKLLKGINEGNIHHEFDSGMQVGNEI